MKSKRIFFAILVTLLLAPALLCAQEIKIGARAEPSIDPHFLYLTTNVGYSQHIFGRLVTRDDNSKPIPDLAESWELMNETTWRFHLRKGVKFHDGSEFTAEDVVFSYERVPNVPNNPGTYAGNIREIQEIKIIDSYTIDIITANPVPILPIQQSNVAIVSKKAVTNATTADFNAGKAAIGTGPYRFVEYIPGERLVLERFEEYWGEKPYYQRVVFRIISNDAARIAALLGADVDIIDFVPPTDVTHLREKGMQVVTHSSDRVIFFVCNTTRETSPYLTDGDGRPLKQNPLKDIRVRKAISMSLNREAIVQRIMEGLAEVNSQMIPRGWYSHNPGIQNPPNDINAAKKLLAEAGYPDGFGLTIHGPTDRYVNDAKVTQAVAQMLSRIGIKVKVETMPQNVYFKRLTPPEQEFVFAMLGWGSSSAGDNSHGLQVTVHTYDKDKKMGSYNAGYSNPELDQIIQAAGKVMARDEREAALQKAMAAAMSDYGIIPLHTQMAIAATRPGISFKSRADETAWAQYARPAK
jgi:peptide/nickel transport system substrate-binding protein